MSFSASQLVSSWGQIAMSMWWTGYIPETVLCQSFGHGRRQAMEQGAQGNLLYVHEFMNSS